MKFGLLTMNWTFLSHTQCNILDHESVEYCTVCEMVTDTDSEVKCVT